METLAAVAGTDFSESIAFDSIRDAKSPMAPKGAVDPRTSADVRLKTQPHHDAAVLPYPVLSVRLEVKQ